ncbi:MAG: hydrolase [Betaproteobacteria bacterium]|jgi:dienelactone hydrolase|nr:MAG: hydrolase [Betaproteobacteria bacterium]
MKPRTVAIAADGVTLPGDLVLPRTESGAARGLVLFAHGSGSSRLSPRNRYVAEVLNEEGLATLLFDLLTPAEDTERAARFDIPLLARRLVAACGWAQREAQLSKLPLGLFGASTGAAAALIAAAELGDAVHAVVSRGGRPDLTPPEDLARVRAPTRLIVGEWDRDVIAMNRSAARSLRCVNDLVLVPGATHLFEEPGTLEQAAVAARDWFVRYLPANAATTSSSST